MNLLKLSVIIWVLSRPICVAFVVSFDVNFSPRNHLRTLICGRTASRRAINISAFRRTCSRMPSNAVRRCASTSLRYTLVTASYASLIADDASLSRAFVQEVGWHG